MKKKSEKEMLFWRFSEGIEMEHWANLCSIERLKVLKIFPSFVLYENTRESTSYYLFYSCFSLFKPIGGMKRFTM